MSRTLCVLDRAYSPTTQPSALRGRFFRILLQYIQGGAERNVKKKTLFTISVLESFKKRKAFCIIGARQIGKTTLVREFARNNYEYFAEINFITDSKASDIFQQTFDAETIITNLTAYLRQPLEAGKTLIFFDEIQKCPQVRTAIKFLVEDGRFDYVESGSLLGVNFQDVPSFPVGFEEIHEMYPMDFEEFAAANGVQQETFSYLYDCYCNRKPVSESVHNTMKKLFYTYIVVGGMPEAVQIFVDTHDIGKVINYQNTILSQYRLDIAQYAGNDDKIKSKAIFDSIPSQLDDKNRRFIVSSLTPSARLNRYENSFKWLTDAGVALACYNVNVPQPALKLNEKHSLFKLYMNDTGLLCAACMENIQFDILNGNVGLNLGSILENVIAQQMKANGFSLYYFDSKKYGELDFVIQNGLQIDLIEVKSGKDYRKHPALGKVLSVDNWKFKNAYVLCQGNIEERNGILYLPWYLSIFLKPAQIPENMIYELDLSGLRV